jgi:hypothetical protein
MTYERNQHGGSAGDHFAVTVEDKDPSVPWLQSQIGTFVEWVTMLSSQPRWEFADYPLHEVLNMYRTLLNKCLPRSFVPNLNFFSEHLPYMYPNVKRKCYRGDSLGKNRHTCRKPGHRCFRNVVSSMRLPGRRAFKNVGRALRCLLFSVWSTWTFRDQSRCGPEICDRYHRTATPPSVENCKCSMCKETMLQPCGATVDAGQAYEALCHSFVFKCLSSLFDTAATPQHAATTVTVFRTPSYRAFLGGHPCTLVDDRAVFWLDRIKHSITCLLGMNVYRICSTFIRQTSGIPIGGPISGAVLEVACAFLEFMFDSRWFRLLLIAI